MLKSLVYQLMIDLLLDKQHQESKSIRPKNRLAELLDRYQTQLSQFAELHTMLEQVNVPSQESQISRTMDRLTSCNLRLQDEIVAGLKQLQSSKSELSQEHKKNLLKYYRGRLFDLTRLERTIQEKVKRNLKMKMVRQVKIIDNQISDESAQRMAQDPEQVMQLVNKAMLKTGSKALQNTVQDLYNKRVELELLANKVNQTNQLLQYISQLMNQQSEQLNTIQQQLAKAEDYVELAAAEVVKQDKERTINRKWLVLILIGMLIALALFVYAAFKTIIL